MNKILLTPTDSIADAINCFPDDIPLEIVLVPGIYYQKLVINRSNLLLRGQDKENTIIVYDDFNNKLHADGLLYNTFRTASVAICGNNVTLENLTIHNSAGYGIKTGQAIALALYGDNTLVENCIIKANQDTLFIGPLPVDLTERYSHILELSKLTTKIGFHRFDNCLIEGNVDFIFGSGDALFNHCEIKMIDKGYLAAPSHYSDSQLGFIFNRCNIRNVTDEAMVLARPWRDYGKVTFYQCQFEGLIDKMRYQTWDKEHFSFFEEPYVKSKYSKPLTDPKIIELLNQVNLTK